MLDKILTDEKTFRILCLILFAILFFIVLKKNKKEQFSQISAENLQKIKNLGDLAKKILNEKKKTSGGNLNFNNLELKSKSINLGSIGNLNTYLTNLNNNINNLSIKYNANVDKVNGMIDGLQTSACLTIMDE